jgi:hypothetical protein
VYDKHGLSYRSPIPESSLICAGRDPRQAPKWKANYETKDTQRQNHDEAVGRYACERNRNSRQEGRRGHCCQTGADKGREKQIGGWFGQRARDGLCPLPRAILFSARPVPPTRAARSSRRKTPIRNLPSAVLCCRMDMVPMPIVGLVASTHLRNSANTVVACTAASHSRQAAVFPVVCK